MIAIAPSPARTIAAALPAAILATRRAIRDDATRVDFGVSAMTATTSTATPRGERQAREYAVAL